MTYSSITEYGAHPQPQSADIRNPVCHSRTSKLSPDCTTLTKKRRSVPKLADPLEILTLVVTGPRRNGRFACPLCASNFGRRCELKRHVVEVHTVNGARRFSSKHPACSKSFTRKDALAKHEIVKHQGKRRFVCPTCTERFTSRYDVSRHNIRVHSNVKKRHTCEFCSAGFSQKGQLTMHKGRVHSSLEDDTRSPRQHSSMDSLAAAVVAIAAEEEAAERKRLEMKDIEGDGNKCGTTLTSGQAAATAAETLLEAAAALQPVCEHSSAPSAHINCNDSTRCSPFIHVNGEVEEHGQVARQMVNSSIGSIRGTV